MTQITKPSELIQLAIDSGAYERHHYMCLAVTLSKEAIDSAPYGVRVQTEQLIMGRLVRKLCPYAKALENALIETRNHSGPRARLNRFKKLIADLREEGV